MIKTFTDTLLCPFSHTTVVCHALGPGHMTVYFRLMTERCLSSPSSISLHHFCWRLAEGLLAVGTAHRVHTLQSSKNTHAHITRDRRRAVKTRRSLCPKEELLLLFGHGLDRPGVLDQLATMLTGNVPGSVHIVAVTGVKIRQSSCPRQRPSVRFLPMSPSFYVANFFCHI